MDDSSLLQGMKTQPYPHQLDGVKFVLQRKTVGLWDEPGAGKSKQAIDAACAMFKEGELDAVLVVCPAGVRGVWDSTNEENPGEIQKHSWVDYCCSRFDAKAGKKFDGCEEKDHLEWVVTSYPFVRTNAARLDAWLARKRVLLVCDEAHALKNRSSAQSKALERVRKRVRYCLSLTGTPYGNDVTDLWSLINIINPTIYPKSYFAFRDEFAQTIEKKIGEQRFKVVTGVKNKKGLDALLEPWVMRRTKELLHLPSKSYSFIEAPMSPEGWRAYSEMKDDLVAYVGTAQSVAQNAAVKAMRLCQITSGFLGGLRSPWCQNCGRAVEEHMSLDHSQCDNYYSPVSPAVEVDAAKHNALLEWIDGKEGVIIWCRFVPELERLVEALSKKAPTVSLYGATEDKQKSIDDFQLGRAVYLVGNQASGGSGLNLTRCHTVAYLSNDFSLINREQSENRVHRPGQKNSVLYVDFMVTSPQGRQTADHKVVSALRKKIDLSRFTMSEWRSWLEKV